MIATEWLSRSGGLLIHVDTLTFDTSAFLDRWYLFNNNVGLAVNGKTAVRKHFLLRYCLRDKDENDAFPGIIE